MKGLSFYSGGEYYAVDASLVRKVTRNMPVTPVYTAPDEVEGIANLMGGVVTILNLEALLGRGRNAANNRRRILNAVVFKTLSGRDDPMGLGIDKPGDLIDIPDDAMVPTEKNVHISGVAEVSAGLCRIIDVESIINLFIGVKTAEIIPPEMNTDE